MNIRMSTKGKRPLRSLTPSDKINAIQRIHDGESKASVARDIGVPESTLRGWCKNEDKLRFMSRQTDKITADSLAEKLGTSAGILVGPPEKRQKLDGSSLPFNYSNKIKYDDMMYKRSSLNGLEYASNKTLSEVSFNGLSTDFIAFSGAVKNKSFGADVSRQSDPAIAAISPLTSLSQLSGLSGLTQSPLAISFNELTSNLNILAQLNPGLAAMSSLNGLGATASTLRNVKTKPQPQLESPRSECGDRQQGLTVKNWAKQKSPTSPSGESCYGLNLRLNEDNNKRKIKCPSPSLAPSLSILSDDPLLYWLKSQQAMLGLSNLYPSPIAPPMGSSSPPLRSSTPQQSAKLHINTPLNISGSITPSSTPCTNLDDKNTAWLNWCKALGASLNSLAPATAAVLHGPPITQPHQSSSNVTIPTDIETTTSTSNVSTQNSHLERILFTQLTKNIDSCSMEHSAILNNAHIENIDSLNKPEDLSSRTIKNNSTATSPSPTPQARSTSPSPNTEESLVPTPAHSPNEQLSTEVPNSPLYNEEAEDCGTNMSDCKDVLDNLLYKINNNPSVISLSKTTTPTSVEGADDDGCISDSNASYGSDNNQNCSDDNVNNNNHSNKTDEEERLKLASFKKEDEDYEAINHGEQFLKWLENCSNPRITASHLMQLRFLISALKSNSDSNEGNCLQNLKRGSTESTSEKVMDTLEDNNPINKGRRRK
ncbi:protein distal antenna [Zeugodacus cucurbitae]|uniref:protein distal antenna n=1 Tax=Zeugodacus cucurbitae TaxID=28588 RepID=UPI00059691D1|nr:protein distal antenna [Zeugodacus cucurbitae]